MAFRNEEFCIGDLVKYKYPVSGPTQYLTGLIVEDEYAYLGKVQVLWTPSNSKLIEWTDDLEVVLAYN